MPALWRLPPERLLETRRSEAAPPTSRRMVEGLRRADGGASRFATSPGGEVGTDGSRLLCCSR
ncbi:MAG: hypothetical protein GY937_15865 [bacterium]|nr:hypothetical protein [bacterium]